MKIWLVFAITAVALTWSLFAVPRCSSGDNAIYLGGILVAGCGPVVR